MLVYTSLMFFSASAILAFCFVVSARSFALSAAISAASVLAAEAPLMVMEDSLAALRLAATLKGRSNRMLESDIFVAALHLYAGIRSAYYNVEANMPAIEKADPALALEMRQHTADILSDANEIFAELSGKK